MYQFDNQYTNDEFQVTIDKMNGLKKSNPKKVSLKEAISKFVR